LLALWAYPACIVPLSYKLHAELAAEHNGAQKWGYRKLQCGSFEAVVPKKKLNNMAQSHEGGGKAWEKLPKQDAAAHKLLEQGMLPKDLDWVDGDLITSWAEMGGPGTTETSQVHPFHFTTSIGELAQSAGVEMKMNAKVTKIATSKYAVERVEYLDRTTGETVEIRDATDIVVTAGPWTGRLLPRAKVEGLRAHSVVYDADVSPFAVFTDIQLPTDFVPEHRAQLGQKRMHKNHVDPEIYARPFGEAYACGKCAQLVEFLKSLARETN
jgi:glycine/D-amino acid oxidase-like deaminating enzyme